MDRNKDTVKTPRLSVVMSVYNGERHLAEAIESIITQSFEDFEFVIIDDGSTDGTWGILNKYAGKDPRIVLSRNEQNIGLTRSLNRGIALAKGEYIARMDADDLSMTDRLELQVRFLDQNPEIGLVSGACNIVDDTGRPIKKISPPLEDEEIKAELLIKNFFGHPEIMARAEIIHRVGGYDEKIPYAQDYDLWCRLIPVARFASLKEQVLIWRDTRENISNVKRKAQLECAFKISLRTVRKHLDAARFDQEAYKRLWWAYHGDFGTFSVTDICRLEPLWSLLESRAALIPRTAEGFGNLGLNLLRRGKLKDGFQVLGMVRRRLGHKVFWFDVAKSLLKGCIKKSMPGK
ncbi:MAG: glycosyltransferase [Candidatus Glassbacteria bacterium]|nr:glycosyltransferase [Candidatus Glassbacteria bacterium]